jgi:hypothetical protein
MTSTSDPRPTPWRKSSRSTNGNTCVEARTNGGGFEVRDSKLGDQPPIFGLDLRDFESLLSTTKHRPTR